MDIKPWIESLLDNSPNDSIEVEYLIKSENLKFHDELNNIWRVRDVAFKSTKNNGKQNLHCTDGIANELPGKLSGNLNQSVFLWHLLFS